MRERAEIVVPEEAADRGHILRGELRSQDVKIPGILAQFSKLSPHKRNASIFLYPTLDEAKILLEARSPFSFDGSMTMDGRQITHYRSSEIWLKSGSEMTFFELRCYTQCSGRLVDLQIRNDPVTPIPKPAKGSAWFVTNGCHLLRLLATPSTEELRNMINRVERPPYRFSLSNDGVAEMARITAKQSRKAEIETTKRAYAIPGGWLGGRGSNTARCFGTPHTRLFGVSRAKRLRILERAGARRQKYAKLAIWLREMAETAPRRGAINPPGGVLQRVLNDRAQEIPGCAR
jgi:hypothetical protein